MFNPARLNNWRKTGKKRQPLNPHAGYKRIRKNDTTFFKDPKTSTTGLSLEIFKNKKFCFKQELIKAGTSSEFGKNSNDDRVIYVLEGSIFITFNSKSGEKVVREFFKGEFFTAFANMEYGFSSSGNLDSYVLIVESSNYLDNWEMYEAEIISDKNVEVPLNDRKDIMPERARISGSLKAREQAIQIANRRKRGRRSSSVFANVNSNTAVGVNLKPIEPVVDLD